MKRTLKPLESFIDSASAKIEPVVTAVSPSNKSTKATPTARLSFPKLLDLSFPVLPSSEPHITQVGEVVYVGDGVVHVAGLDQATIEEIVEVKTHRGVQQCLILGVTETRVEAVVLGDYSAIKRGDQATATGRPLKVPAGKGVLGRVLTPLGDPLDGKGTIKAEEFRDVEFPAPGVMEREPIDQPLHTGIMVIDSAIPIGKGQRELVIGDRKTGKTRTLIDIICNQKGQNIVCVYVGISLQAAKAKSIYKMLEDRGAMTYTTVVLSMADEPPSLQYIAPYAGVAIAEYFMYQGKDVLIVYDDLSKQAKAYRQVSLLLKRSPGRDAYPGDIFFLHSRLLERSARVTKKLGGGSITALPIAETQAGDVSDYIITNLMSITDGHIYLDANLMHEGILPAVDSATSVSRIGGKVQTPLLRKVGELTGRTLARYNEVKSFETINTEVAEETIRDIKRGKRIKEVLSQRSSFNYTVAEEVVVLALATSARMDHFDLAQVVTFKENIIEFQRQHGDPELLKKCDTVKSLDEVEADLDALFANFCRNYQLPLTHG